ncbi:MAG: hypothetical protein R2736_10710 [Solirubrobacterales bacterium]
MRAANRVRTPERAQAARNDRTAALVEQLVTQLGQMRGAAMKVGQLLSMVDFDGLPEDQRDDLQRRLAALRDDAAGAVPQAREAHARGGSVARSPASSPTSSRARSPRRRSARSTARRPGTDRWSR